MCERQTQNSSAQGQSVTRIHRGMQNQTAAPLMDATHILTGLPWRMGTRSRQVAHPACAASAKAGACALRGPAMGGTPWLLACRVKRRARWTTPYVRRGVPCIPACLRNQAVDEPSVQNTDRLTLVFPSSAVSPGPCRNETSPTNATLVMNARSWRAVHNTLANTTASVDQQSTRQGKRLTRSAKHTMSSFFCMCEGGPGASGTFGGIHRPHEPSRGPRGGASRPAKAPPGPAGLAMFTTIGRVLAKVGPNWPTSAKIWLTSARDTPTEHTV